jgi:hypothetical protein
MARQERLIRRLPRITSAEKALRSRSGSETCFDGVALSLNNRRARDFNLKTQRRQIRLVDVPQGAGGRASCK